MPRIQDEALPVHQGEPPPRYYHGGPAGLEPGEILLPPSQTGRVAHPSNPDVAAPVRDDRVFITTSRTLARIFASRAQRGGNVYEVQPIGELEVDYEYPQDQEVSEFMVPRARVLCVVDRGLDRAWYVAERFRSVPASRRIADLAKYVSGLGT